jgi:hypothetical protein
MKENLRSVFTLMKATTLSDLRVDCGKNKS